MELDKLDIGILDMIDKGRELYGACTARWVANQLNLSADVCRYRLMAMKEAGYVDWNDMPGSLTRLVREAGTTDGSPSDQASPEATTETPGEAGEPSQEEAPTAQPAPTRKKATASKRPAKSSR